MTASVWNSRTALSRQRPPYTKSSRGLYLRNAAALPNWDCDDGAGSAELCVPQHYSAVPNHHKRPQVYQCGTTKSRGGIRRLTDTSALPPLSIGYNYADQPLAYGGCHGHGTAWVRGAH